MNDMQSRISRNNLVQEDDLRLESCSIAEGRRKSQLSEVLIIDAAREYYRINNRLPTCKNSIDPVPFIDDATWSGIELCGRKGYRGLEQGRTLYKILKPLRHEIRCTRRLNENDIIAAVRAYYEYHQRLPNYNDNSHTVPNMEDETWSGINRAGLRGTRGLTKGRTLHIITESLRDELGLSKVLTEDVIIEAARKYYELYNKFPIANDSKSPVPGLPSDTWSAINAAGFNGARGLTKGRKLTTILKPLKKELGLTRELNEADIIQAARKFYRLHTKLPTNSSSELEVPGMPGETWRAIGTACLKGYRGLVKNRPLNTILEPLATELNLHTELTEEKIVEAARKYHSLYNALPRCNDSETEVPDMANETWSAINSAGQDGRRGLAKGRTLHQILIPLDKELYPEKLLTEQDIIDAARTYYEIYNKLPECSNSTDPVPGMPNESWKRINAAAYSGHRGLTKGRSLPTILSPLRFELGLDKTLSESKILDAAREFYRLYGRLPTADKDSPVPGFESDTWVAINSAAYAGNRGLRKGRSLSKILVPLREELEMATNWAKTHVRGSTRTQDTLEAEGKGSIAKRIYKRSVRVSNQPVVFLKGEVFEQLVGVALSSSKPSELIIPQYCLITHGTKDTLVYGMRADFKVGSHIYEIKWGNNTENIHETYKKHNNVLGDDLAYRLLLLKPNSGLAVPYTLFRDLEYASALKEELDEVLAVILERVKNSDKEMLVALRDYLYGLVMYSNSLKNQKRIDFLKEGMNLIISASNNNCPQTLSSQTYGLYSPMAAYFHHNNQLYRGTISSRVLEKENERQYETRYFLGDLTFSALTDLRVAVCIELSDFQGRTMRVEECLPAGKKKFLQPKFILPDGRVLSRADSADIVIRADTDLSKILPISNELAQFAEDYISYELDE